MLDERARDDMAIVREMLSISSEVARLSGRVTALTDEFCRRVEGRPQADDPAEMDRRAADWNGSLESIPQFLPERTAPEQPDARPENSTRPQSEGLPDNARDFSADTTVGITGAALPVEAETFVTVAGAGEGVLAPVDPAPAPDAKTKHNQVLDLWAGTDLSKAEIAKRVGCAPGSPDTFIAIARKVRDERIGRGEVRRGKATEQTVTQLAAEIAGDLAGLIASNPAGLTYAILQEHYGATQKTLQPAMTVLELRGTVRRTNKDRTRWHLPEAQAPAAKPALAAAPVRAEPSPPPQPVPEIERRVPRHVETDEITTLVPARRKEAVKPIAADHCVRAPAPARSEDLHLVPVTSFMAIDETANVVAGPKGEWQTHRPCVLTLRRLGKLQPGQFLDAATLAGTAIDKKAILDSMPTWQRELGRIGIEVVKVGREMFALKAAA